MEDLIIAGLVVFLISGYLSFALKNSYKAKPSPNRISLILLQLALWSGTVGFMLGVFVASWGSAPHFQGNEVSYSLSIAHEADLLLVSLVLMFVGICLFVAGTLLRAKWLSTQIRRVRTHSVPSPVKISRF